MLHRKLFGYDQIDFGSPNSNSCYYKRYYTCIYTKPPLIFVVCFLKVSPTFTLGKLYYMLLLGGMETRRSLDLTIGVQLAITSSQLAMMMTRVGATCLSLPVLAFRIFRLGKIG